MSRFTTTIIATALIAVAVIVPQTAGAQISTSERVPTNTIGANPVGMVINGLSFIEYTRAISPNASFVARLDYIRWSEEESEVEGFTDVFSYQYEESGKGPGVGVGIRYYMPLSESVDFEISSGVDIIQVNWEWTEAEFNANGALAYAPDSGDGTTTAFAFHGGFGAKINVGATRQFFVEPQVLFGSVALDVERDSGESVAGAGFFFGGALVLGVNL